MQYKASITSYWYFRGMTSSSRVGLFLMDRHGYLTALLLTYKNKRMILQGCESFSPNALGFVDLGYCFTHLSLHPSSNIAISTIITPDILAFVINYAVPLWSSTFTTPFPMPCYIPFILCSCSTCSFVPYHMLLHSVFWFPIQSHSI